MPDSLITTATAIDGAAVDEVCAAAADLALAAAIDVAGDAAVGEHLGAVAEADRVVTHRFACRLKGYRGWHWAVTVARGPRVKRVTVSEVVLLPGGDAVLAPTWLAWEERLRPGDLGAADQLPYRADDPLLEAGYQATDDEDADAVALWELGLGRVRVLSREGRDDAADRWHRGDRGPIADEAIHAAAPCSSCGYLLRLAGSMRQAFGVCANEWSPSDGQVVSLDHGCGAHSETDIERHPPEPLPEPIVDDLQYDLIVLPPRDAADESVAVETEAVETEAVETEVEIQPEDEIQPADEPAAE